MAGNQIDYPLFYWRNAQRQTFLKDQRILNFNKEFNFYKTAIDYEINQNYLVFIHFVFDRD